MEFIAARFPFLELLPIFWLVRGLKNLTKYVRIFENSQNFAWEEIFLIQKLVDILKQI